jgi:Holliday junction resolvase RusA-like endonuclease
MPSSLRLTYPVLPPSENHIRQIRWGRVNKKPKPLGMCYTPEAEHYKRLFREHMRTHFFVEIQKFRRQHQLEKVYVLRLLFYFPPKDILNTTWPTAKGKKKPKSPYKKMDVGNRRKLLEDCFAESIDVDDSLNFGLEAYKFVSDDPRVDLILEEEDPASFGIPPEYYLRE